MTEIIGLDHIQIAAPPNSEEQARHFYGTVLGLTEIPKPENLQGRGGCWFKCGSQEFHIGIQKHFQPATKAHPAFTVHSLQKLHQALVQAGYPIKEDSPIAGRERLFTEDPFGNRIEFLSFQNV